MFHSTNKETNCLNNGILLQLIYRNPIKDKTDTINALIMNVFKTDTKDTRFVICANHTRWRIVYQSSQIHIPTANSAKIFPFVCIVISKYFWLSRHYLWLERYVDTMTLNILEEFIRMADIRTPVFSIVIASDCFDQTFLFGQQKCQHKSDLYWFFVRSFSIAHCIDSMSFPSFWNAFAFLLAV